jgi:CBS domain-containing protein
MRLEHAAAIVALVTLVAAVGLRTYTEGKVTINLQDATIAAIAVVLLLLIYGRIEKFGVGKEGLTFEIAKQAIIAASEQKIGPQVAALPVESLEVALKAGTAEIPNLVRRQIPALEFILGTNYQVESITKDYLEALTPQPFFRFVVLAETNGKLFGVIEARKLLSDLQNPASGLSFASFVQILNRANSDDRAQLAKVSGFVPASAAVRRDDDKREVLERMEKLNADWLPVVKSGDQFDGIVERSRLTASLILDVTNRLREGGVEKK